MKSRLLTLVASSFLIPALSVFAADGGSVVGKITLSGKAPETKTKSPEGMDEKGKIMHPKGVPIRNYIVGADGGLANVFVYVKDGLAGKKFPAPTTSVTLDQQGCLYNPMVFGIQVGQTLVIQNSDDTSHNIHAMSTKNPEFNLAQPQKGMKSEKQFAKPEVFVKFICDVHGWMTAYAGVVDHPFFSVTKEDGSFCICNLPPGDYTIAAIHPKAGEQTVKVKVAAGEVKAEFKPFAAK